VQKAYTLTSYISSLESVNCSLGLIYAYTAQMARIKLHGFGSVRKVVVILGFLRCYVEEGMELLRKLSSCGMC
jgi:hypothetical protein